MKTNQNTRLLDGRKEVINKSHLGGLLAGVCRLDHQISHAEFNSASSTHAVMLWQQQRQALKTLNQVQGDLMITTTSGFTLIELLVVVLIIGILANVALPQYHIAVERARAANVWPLLKAINEAEQRKNLEEGTKDLPYSLRDLDLDFNNIQSGAVHVGGDGVTTEEYISTADFDIGLTRGKLAAIAVRKRDTSVYALGLQNGKKMCIPFNSSTDPYSVSIDAEICKKIVGQTVGSNCLTGSTCYTE